MGDYPLQCLQLQFHQPTSCLKNNLRMKMVALGPPLSWLLQPSSDRWQSLRNKRSKTHLAETSPKTSNLAKSAKIYVAWWKKCQCKYKIWRFPGRPNCKKWAESGQKIHTIYFPRKENRNASLVFTSIKSYSSCTCLSMLKYYFHSQYSTQPDPCQELAS